MALKLQTDSRGGRMVRVVMFGVALAGVIAGLMLSGTGSAGAATATRAHSFGDNQYDQLGDGTTDSRGVPSR